MTNLIITGAKGRMGQALISCATRIPEVKVTGQIDLGDDLEKVITGGDAVIDFSFHSATLDVARACARHKKSLVIGTTGHSDEERQKIVEAIKEIPVVWASNYSTGVNTLFWLTRKATEILGPSFDLEVVEMHHRLKKDAPSGTAMT
jgi:4-hydroxy-tetrahydrodipicolinate reductase